MFTMAAILNNPAAFPGGANDYIDPSDDAAVHSKRWT